MNGSSLKINPQQLAARKQRLGKSAQHAQKPRVPGTWDWDWDWVTQG
jgi:hypothetical protein